MYHCVVKSSMCSATKNVIGFHENSQNAIMYELPVAWQQLRHMIFSMQSVNAPTCCMLVFFTLRSTRVMPGPCSAFQSVNNFGNRFYRKEKRPGCALPFWMESVTKVFNRLKRTTWTRYTSQVHVL